ncbi:methyltransferase, partial [Staphylococcus aureus]
DTEALVDLALSWMPGRVARDGTLKLLDLGTGTGAIALALLASEPRATAVATDIAPGALETAGRNAETLGLADRIACVQ